MPLMSLNDLYGVIHRWPSTKCAIVAYLYLLLKSSLICPISLAGVNCLAYDEAIIAQQDRIQQEVRYPFIEEGRFPFFMVTYTS